MLHLRYYCKGIGTWEVCALLAAIKTRHGIPYEIRDLSRHGEYNEGKEKEIYENDFKPRAKLLKQRTGRPITSLRSQKARHYVVSNPGTMAIIGDDGVEWYTIGDGEILQFLTTVQEKGQGYLVDQTR